MSRRQGGRRGRDDVRTRLPIWTGYSSFSWSRSDGKPGGGQRKRLARRHRFSSHRSERWEENLDGLLKWVLEALIEPIGRQTR
jgi:hypothetical protein